MKIIPLIIILCFIPYWSFADDVLVTLEEAKSLAKTISSGKPGSDTLTKTLVLSKNIKLKYKFNITSKGNGVIDLFGSFIRLYDKHQDGSYFKSGLLNNKIVDLDNDGYKDIVLWGTAIVEDEEGSVPREVAVVSILMFDPLTKKLVARVKSKQIDIY